MENPPLVLVGSNQVIDLNSMEIYLLSKNYLVSLAQDQDGVFSFLKDITPNLIILDEKLPPLGVGNVLDKIRHVKRLKKVPAVVLSERVSERLENDALYYNAEVLMKPFREKGFLFLVNKLLTSEQDADCFTIKQISATNKNLRLNGSNVKALLAIPNPYMSHLLHGVLPYYFKVIKFQNALAIERQLAYEPTSIQIAISDFTSINALQKLQLKYFHKKYNIPFILLVSSGDVSEAKRLFQEDLCIFLQKPFNALKLLKVIQESSEKYNLQSSEKYNLQSSEKYNIPNSKVLCV